MTAKTAAKVLRVPIPDKLGFLFRPCRYKVCYGGRGGGRSWSFARALLVQGYQRPLRILCAREVQDSIKQSVHKLLCDQIKLLDFNRFYQIRDVMIKGINGTEITFTGLSNLTADNIKSMEGVDICWCEEAHNISKKSWNILIPTIRKEGSEIWVTFNPSLETDETWQRFVVNPPKDCITVKLNWRDNPWFPEVLEKERQYCKANNPAEYDNIWEGECKPAVEGAIYYDEITKAEREGRICRVPYDPLLKVHIVMDLGWSDKMAIGLVQKSLSEIRIIEYIEEDHKTLDYYSSLLRERKYNWGKMWLPHDAKSKDIKTGLSTQQIFDRLGWDTEIVPSISLEEGIRITRMAFGRIYFDKDKCDQKDRDGHGSLIECCKRYKRKLNKTTGALSTPLHDEWSHGADMLRYLCIAEPQMTNEDERPVREYHPGYGVLDAVVGY